MTTKDSWLAFPVLMTRGEEGESSSEKDQAVVLPRQQVFVSWFRVLVEVGVISSDNRKASLFVVCRVKCVE
jgi:hypothetical protein